MGDIVGRVVVHRQLLEDHLALALDVGRPQGRPADQLAEQVDPGGRVARRHAAVVGGVLLGRVGVDVATHPIDGLADLDRPAVGGALEQHMFEEVAHAGLAHRVVTPADADPHADRGRAGVAHRLDRNDEPARQSHNSLRHVDLRLTLGAVHSLRVTDRRCDTDRAAQRA
jgi:hypothetical protein